jgi:hypothetical protein
MNERICPICLSYKYLDNLKGWMRCPSCGHMSKELNSMISLQEMCGNKYEDLSPELQANSLETLKRVNAFRAIYNIPMIVTSGYRTVEHNAAIGGAKDSSHCECKAIDFADKDNKLKDYIIANPDILDKCDLYQEDPASTPTWVHLTIRPPASGVRVFKP